MHGLVTFVAQYFVAIPVAVWLLVAWRCRGPQRWRFIFLTFVSAVFTALLVKLATTMHQDPRPFVRDDVRPYFSSSTDNGFPSDHAAFGTVLALVVARQNWRLGAGLGVVVAMLGTARVIAGVHHAQDIVGGIGLAAVAVGVALLLWEYIIAPKFQEESHD